MTEFADLDNDTQDRLVNSSLNLMRDLTEAYGSDRGLALWEVIGSEIGNDIKGKIFFGLISGEYSTSGVMYTKANTDTPVQAIRAIRTATGLGLKDAKDIYDYVRDTGPKRIECSGTERKALLDTLLYNGHSAH